MRKNPIERAEKFHLGKGDKCRRGPLIKSSCFTVIFFRALSLTLPFHYLCSSREKKKSPLLYLVAISSFPITFPFSSGEKRRKKSAQNLAVFSDNPLVVVGVKRESAWMSNCPQNTMKDWFAALFRPLTLLGGELNRKPVSRGWNKDVLSAGKEGKLPI